MIIPVRCFTCGTVIADKYQAYLRLVREGKAAQGATVDVVTYLTRESRGTTVEGDVMNRLGLTQMCCRRHMLTQASDPAGE